MEVSNICIQYLKKNIRISILKSLSELCPSRRIQCASGESSQPARKIPPASSFLPARGNPLLPARPRRPRRSSAACAVVVEVLCNPRRPPGRPDVSAHRPDAAAGLLRAAPTPPRWRWSCFGHPFQAVDWPASCSGCSAPSRPPRRVAGVGYHRRCAI